MLQTKKSLLLLVVCALLSGTANRTFAQGLTIEKIALKDSQETELSKKLVALEGVTDVVRIKNDVPIFSEKYAAKINQLINPNDPSVGAFTQQIYICHVGYDAPTIVITDGYTAGFAMNPRYSEELSHRYKANIVAIQHRYFEQSTPVPTDWQYMRGKYAAHDMHVITNTMKKLYKGKFIASGVSKGGQNTMIYATYYPNDMDFFVPYVGPICTALEDGRHEGFLAKIGTKEQQKRIFNFQAEVLKRRKSMVALLEKYSQENNITYNIGLDEVLDMCVLEYSFALWQMNCEQLKKVPLPVVSDDVLFKHLVEINDPSYFSNVPTSTSSFYIQAAMELGYYGYDTKPFKKWLSIKTTSNYLKRLVIPSELSSIEFNDELHKDMYKFLGENDPKMVLIYGEYDPWTAVAPDAKLLEGKKNMKLFLCPKYDHKTRIGNFPEETKAEIWTILDNWMKQ